MQIQKNFIQIHENIYAVVVLYNIFPLFMNISKKCF